MTPRNLGAYLVVQGLLVAVAVSCGGTTVRKTESSAGEAGTSDSGGSGDGRGGRGSTAGAPNGGKGGSPVGGNSAGGASDVAGAAGEGGAAAEGGTAGEGGVTYQGGAAGEGNAGEGGAVDEPIVDLGPGCIAPASAPALSPSAAGLPAAGLALWLRGDRGVYATDQHRVCGWADQSGNKFLFGANGGGRPLWQASGLGAKPALDFDATNTWLSISGVLGIPATSGRTLIAVVQSVNTTDRFAAIQQGQSGTPGTYLALDANTFNTAGSHEGVYLCNNSYDAALATGTDPRVHVYTINTMVPTLPVLSNVEYRVNGAVQSLTRRDGGLGNGNIEDFSNANFSLVGSGGRSLIAEVIVYNRALTSEERTAVDTALKARYAIE